MARPAQLPGNAFADFLLGFRPQRILPSLDQLPGHTRDWSFTSGYFQVTAKLTLNYGLRYLYHAPGCA